MLIVGGARVAAAAKIGLATIPVIVARGWSEEEKNAYRIADNQLAARASWDPDLLRSELQRLDFGDFDLGLIGFEADALETILAGLGTSGLTDPDSVPDRPDQPITRVGDVWQLGQHRVGCGDSTSTSDVAPVLMGSQPLLMVTDPPYGVGYDPAWRARRGLSAGNLARGKNVRRLGNDPEHLQAFTRRSLRSMLLEHFSHVDVSTAFPWLVAAVLVPSPSQAPSTYGSIGSWRWG